MMKKNFQRYNGLARLFHWGMGALIFGLLIAGYLMTELPVSPLKFQVYGIHKSLGILILALAVLRLAWRFFATHPAPLSSHAYWEQFLSKTIHIVLYISFFVMPLSGWVMSSAGDYSISFFGMFDLPPITPKNEAIFEVSKGIHMTSALLLVGAIGLHVAGALKHWLIDRDETLYRIGGNFVFVLIGVLLLGITFVLAGRQAWESAYQVVGHGSYESVQAAELLTADLAGSIDKEQAVQEQVHEWVIDPRESRLEISFNQYGQPVESVFEDWSGQIVFDPERLDSSQVQVQINIASLKTGSADRDEQARGEEWFDAQTYPLATFKSESFRAFDANRYQVDGYLSLRGVNLPLSFPFNLQINEEASGDLKATMQTEFELKRLDFGIGQGQWKATDAVGNSVDVRIKIQARSSSL